MSLIIPYTTIVQYTVLNHPSSGQVSITFGQDPLHLDDDITQYMQHGPLQYMASSFSHITICLNPSDLPPSIQFSSIQTDHTSLAHFHKAQLTYMCLMALA